MTSRWRCLTPRTVAVAAALAAAAPAHAAACTVTWDGQGSDLLWSTGLNWTGDAAPGANDDVCIGSFGGGPVVVDTAVTVATVAASHPIAVAAGQSLSAILDGGTYTLGDGASLVGAKIDGATVVVGVGDRATAAGGEFAAGTIRGGGELHITGSFAWTGGRMLGDGVTSVAPGATVIIDAPGSNGSPQNYGASLEEDRHLGNAGTIVWTRGYVGINDQATLHNAGTLSLQSPINIWENNTDPVDASVLNTGLIEKPVGTNRVFFPGVDNDGVIRIIRGELEVNTLLQTTDSRIEIELGGTAARTGHGVISTRRGTRLSGTLAITLSPGFSPADGDVFRVIAPVRFSLPARKGTFTALEAPALSGGRTLVPAYLANGMDLAVSGAPPGPGTTSGAGDFSGLGVDSPPALVAPAALAPLRAADDAYRRRSAGLIVIGPRRGLLANDSFPAGTRIELVRRSRRALRVHLDRRTGGLRVRLRPSARGRVLRLRYRLVAPSGRRSRVASVRIHLV